MASYPFSDVKIRVIRTPIQSSVATGTRSWGTFVSELSAFETAQAAKDGVKGSYSYYMGFVKLLPGATVLGQSFMPGHLVTLQSPNKPDGTETNNWRGTMIHELGHNFNLGHTTTCNWIGDKDQEGGYEPRWGYDARYERMIDPAQYAILLTTVSCNPARSTWWSQTQYNYVQSRINGFTGGLLHPPAGSALASEWK
jgi:hypothetical protein